MPKNIVFCADGTWSGPGEPVQEDFAPRPTTTVRHVFELAKMAKVTF
jgi:hypothetical protein